MTPYPQLFRTIIVLVKFADMPPIPAIGYAANAIDDPDMIYFASPLERKGWDWSLIARWDYLEDVAPRYLVPSWEGNKKETGK